MNILKTEKTYLMMKRESGKLEHIETHVTYSWDYDPDAPDFDYGDEAENRKEMARFDSGECLNVLFKVTCQALGENGYDILGQCFVTSKNFESDLLNIAAEHDMKNNACLELKSNLESQYQLLKKHLA